MKSYQDARASVSLSACSGVAPAEQFMQNLILETFIKILRRVSNFIKVGQKYRGLCMKTKCDLFVLATLIRHKCPLGVKWYQAVRIAEML
jgi:hypothetical protein